jgi:secreted PhoX family phosphatase
LLVCEDRMTNNLAGQSLAGLNTEGELFLFARINPGLQARINGIDLRETAVISEWAGVTFSRDGEWLFANIYNPGITVAITGPWQQGLI